MSGEGVTQPLVELGTPRLVLERPAAGGELGRFVKDARVPLVHVIVAACGRALASLPEANVVATEGGGGGRVRLEEVSVGLALATDQGPVAPVVRRADLPLPVLFAEIDRLIAATRDGRLCEDDFSACAMTVLHGASRQGTAAGRLEGCVLDVQGADGGAPELRLTLDCSPLDAARAELLLSALVRLLEHPYRRLV